VASREFYLSIAVALLPTLAWAFVIFGWRVLGMFVGATASAVLMHLLLNRFTVRGKLLIFPHSLVAAWVLVALADPQWPIWIVSLIALFIPPVLWLVGGPGKGRLHIAVILALVLQFGLVPLLQNVSPNTGAILARDRLVMGDIRSQSTLGVYQWPRSSEISGNDALAMERPAHLALVTLDQLARHLSHQDYWHSDGSLDIGARRHAQSLLDDALAKLPSMNHFLLGVSPGRAGAVFLIGLLGSGLFLAYRHILRSRSATFFLVVFSLFSALIALWPACFDPGSGHFSFAPTATWRIYGAFPAETVTLLAFAILNSDAFFAAIIILALPGTEPLTPRGRRGFLFFTSLLAAILHRSILPIPAATVAISIFMPLAPRFDQYFARRSWLNRSM